MTVRKFLFWSHLATGVGAGVVVLVMSVTGVALTYERQLIKWSDRQFRSVPSSDGQRLPVERLLAEFTRQAPGRTPGSVTISAGATAPVAVGVERTTFYVDAYSGRLLGPANEGMRAGMSKIRSWHRWLAAEGPRRPLARAVTGWANVLFVLLIVTGLTVWIPRQWNWRAVRAVALFRRGQRGKARDFNWHNVIGIWSAVPLLVVVVSAVPISFPWGNALLYRVMGETPPSTGRDGRGPAGAASAAVPASAVPSGRRPGPREQTSSRPQASIAPSAVSGMDALVAQAQRSEPDWQTITVRLPASTEAPVTLAIDRGDGGQPHLRSTLTLARTGAVVSHEPFSAQTPARRVRSLMRFAHTGEVLGVAGQTVAGAASAGSVVLVWTGFALALRRLLAWASRRAASTRAAERTRAGHSHIAA